MKTIVYTNKGCWKFITIHFPKISDLLLENEEIKIFLDGDIMRWDI